MSAALPWMRLFGGLAIIWLLLTYVGPADYADALVMDAMRKEFRVERVKRAELLCDCLKTNWDRWLRLQVTHQPDRELCKTTCFYEGGTATEGTL